MRPLMLLLGSLLFLSFFEGGCTSVIAEQKIVQPQGLQFQRLKRSEFRILGGTDATRCVRLYSAFPLPLWFTLAEDDPEDAKHRVYFQMWGVDAVEIATVLARAKAIEKSWHADALLVPRREVERLSVLPFYERVCVTVRGSAIELIQDAELKKPDNKPAETPEMPEFYAPEPE